MGQEPAEAPAYQLPQVAFANLDEFDRVGMNDAVGDLIRLLHNVDYICTKPGIAYFACLMMLADRYDCLPVASLELDRRGLAQRSVLKAGIWDDEASAACTEQSLRQAIFVSCFLDRPKWFRSSSQSLIIKGSGQWTKNDTPTKDNYLWRDLPYGIEGMDLGI